MRAPSAFSTSGARERPVTNGYARVRPRRPGGVVRSRRRRHRLVGGRRLDFLWSGRRRLHTPPDAPGAPRKTHPVNPQVGSTECALDRFATVAIETALVRHKTLGFPGQKASAAEGVPHLAGQLFVLLLELKQLRHLGFDFSRRRLGFFV